VASYQSPFRSEVCQGLGTDPNEESQSFDRSRARTTSRLLAASGSSRWRSRRRCISARVLSSTGSASAFSRMLSQIESTSASLSSTGKLRIASSGLAVDPALARCHRQSPPPRFSASSGASGASWPVARLARVPSALATCGYVWLRVATCGYVQRHRRGVLARWQGALLARDGGRQVGQVTPERTAEVATNVASYAKRTFTHGARRSMIPPDPSGPQNLC
jgi:hypothetical protein